MSNLSHPNIVRLYGITLKPLALIMELMAFGDLHDLLEPLYKAHTHPSPGFALRLSLLSDSSLRRKCSRTTWLRWRVT